MEYRHRNQYDSTIDAHTPGGHTCQDDSRRIGASYPVWKSTQQRGHEVSQSHQIVRALHNPKVGRAWPAPRNLLDRDRVADGVDGGCHDNDYEPGQERPERGPEAQVKPRPLIRRQTNPRGLKSLLEVEHAPRHRRYTSRQKPGERDPLLPCGRGEQPHADENDKSGPSERGSRSGRSPFRYVRQSAEYD